MSRAPTRKLAVPGSHRAGEGAMPAQPEILSFATLPPDVVAGSPRPVEPNAPRSLCRPTASTFCGSSRTTAAPLGAAFLFSLTLFNSNQASRPMLLNVSSMSLSTQ